MTFSQTPSSPETGNIPTEVFILSGSASGNNTLFSWKDFKSMVPESSLLKEDFSGFSNYGDGSLYGHTYFGLQLGRVIGKTRRANGKDSPLIRLGIGYESGDYFDANLGKETSFRYDTLFNSQGQSVYFRDSTRADYCYMLFSSSAVNLELSALLRSNTQRRWMFYTGAGIAAGVTFNNLIQIYRTTRKYIEEFPVNSASPGNGHSQNGTDIVESDYETFNVGSSWTFAGYIPLGIDFRIGKKSEFLKHFHLFTEARPGIKIIDLPTSRTMTGSFFLGTFGLRAVWK